MFQVDKDLSQTRIIEHPCLVKWREEIDDAERNGGFTFEQCLEATSWDNCAVGEASKKYEFELNDRNAPVDSKLRGLGVIFSNLVVNNHIYRDSRIYDQCREVINQIENRLVEICFHYTNLQPLWWQDNVGK